MLEALLKSFNIDLQFEIEDQTQNLPDDFEIVTTDVDDKDEQDDENEAQSDDCAVTICDEEEDENDDLTM